MPKIIRQGEDLEKELEKIAKRAKQQDDQQDKNDNNQVSSSNEANDQEGSDGPEKRQKTSPNPKPKKPSQKRKRRPDPTWNERSEERSEERSKVPRQNPAPDTTNTATSATANATQPTPIQDALSAKKSELDTLIKSTQKLIAASSRIAQQQLTEASQSLLQKAQHLVAGLHKIESIVTTKEREQAKAKRSQTQPPQQPGVRVNTATSTSSANPYPPAMRRRILSKSPKKRSQIMQIMAQEQVVTTSPITTPHQQQYYPIAPQQIPVGQYYQAPLPQQNPRQSPSKQSQQREVITKLSNEFKWISDVNNKKLLSNCKNNINKIFNYQIESFQGPKNGNLFKFYKKCAKITKPEQGSNPKDAFEAILNLYHNILYYPAKEKDQINLVETLDNLFDAISHVTGNSWRDKYKPKTSIASASGLSASASTTHAKETTQNGNSRW